MPSSRLTDSRYHETPVSVRPVGLKITSDALKSPPTPPPSLLPSPYKATALPTSFFSHPTGPARQSNLGPHFENNICPVKRIYEKDRSEKIKLSLLSVRRAYLLIINALDGHARCHGR